MDTATHLRPPSDTQHAERLFAHGEFQEMPRVFVHKLKVKEADAQDVWLNIVRIDTSSMILMGLEIGDIVLLTGRNGGKAAAICLDSKFLEIEPAIRMDKILRYNLDLDLDETITSNSIAKATQSLGNFRNEIILESMHSDVPPMVDERYILQSLQWMPLTQGQVVLVPYFDGKWYTYALLMAKTTGDVDDEVILIGPNTKITIF
jgi:hypothetical protein